MNTVKLCSLLLQFLDDYLHVLQLLERNYTLDESCLWGFHSHCKSTFGCWSKHRPSEQGRIIFSLYSASSLLEGTIFIVVALGVAYSSADEYIGEFIDT